MGKKKNKSVVVPAYTKSNYENDKQKFEESIKTGQLDLASFHRLMTRDLCVHTSVIENGCIGNISMGDIELALKYPKQGWRILLQVSEELMRISPHYFRMNNLYSNMALFCWWVDLYDVKENAKSNNIKNEDGWKQYYDDNGKLISCYGIDISYYQKEIDTKTEEHGKITTQINSIKAYLAKHESISTDIFDEGDEIRIGLIHNKAIYSYYTIVGTEIPKKVWLTYLKLGNNVEIAGQADNLESIYSFYRNLKNYDEESRLSIKKLSLASNSPVTVLSDEESFETESLLTSVNADYYEFVITDGEVTGPPSAEEASAVPDKILKR